MKLHLDENELFEAILDYMRGLGIPLDGRNIDIQMKAGRGERGHYADIEVHKDPSKVQPNPFTEDKVEGEDPNPGDTAINFDD